jgi:GTP-binding protein EngB required for normal cell division
MQNDHDLGERIRFLVTSVAAIAGELGYADRTATAEMAALRDRLDHVGATVVVAGEAKVGKSSLLNALMGRPELLPTDHLVATNAPVMLRNSTPERIGVWLEGERDARSVPLGDLRRWATVADFEERRRADAGASPVSAIDVQLDAPQLGELVLVDTPGVGGLVAAHARVTLEALRHADALVFVLQSRSPASEQELAFLENAAAQVPAVIVVLSKADGPRAAWEAVLAENRRLVGTRLGSTGDWPIIPVSALSAVSALEARAEGAEDEARSFDEASGFERLRAELRTRIEARARLLRYARVVQFVGSVLTRCASGVEARRLAAAPDETSRQAQKAQLDAVEVALAPDAAWRGLLQAAVTELTTRLDAESARRLQRNLEWTYAGPVERGEMTDLGQLVRDLDREVTALHGTLRQEYMQHVLRTVRRIQSMLGSEGLSGLVNDLAPPVGQPDALPAARGPRLADSVDRDALIQAGTLGLGTTGFLTSGGLGAITAAAGAAAAPAAASGAVALPAAAGGAAAGGATAGGAAAAGAAAVALGPALVIGAFVGAAALGLKTYQNHKAAQVQRATQALERAVLAANEVRRAFLAQAEMLGVVAAEVVEQRLVERRRELGGGQVDQEADRREDLAALDAAGARLDRLQDERADLRAAIAARLGD